MPGRLVILLLLIASAPLAGCVHAAADRAMTENHAPTRPEAMRALDSWIGVWKGSGWVIREDGTRAQFTRVERIERKVAGTVLLLEGEGVTESNTNEAAIANQGLVMIHYDDGTRTYRWNGHDASRGATEAELKLIEGGVEWTVRNQDRTAAIRFTIRLNGPRWHEVGEVTKDGKAWKTFMEANLQRQE
jgi:hypothetical protein